MAANEMSFSFVILALITLGGAVAAMTLRHLVHCVLCLVIAFAGLAMLYLQLGAQFVGLVQILVYIGAVAILIVFAILLTRGVEWVAPSKISNSPWAGILVALLVLLSLGAAVLKSNVADRLIPPAEPGSAIRSIGEKLMGDYILPLEIMGLLLTVALIGAVVIAMRENRRSK